VLFLFAEETLGRNAAAAIETDLHRGTYLDPDAGRIRFRDYAEQWRQSQFTDPATTHQSASGSGCTPTRSSATCSCALISKTRAAPAPSATRSRSSQDRAMDTHLESPGSARPTLRTYTHVLPSSDGRTRDIIDAAFRALPAAPTAPRVPRMCHDHQDDVHPRSSEPFVTLYYDV
jgi:hypothetical protein